MHYSTIPYFSVTLLFNFFFNFIWLACYNLQTYLPQVSEENGQESTSWIMVSSETECFSLNISLHTYSSIFDFRQIIYHCLVHLVPVSIDCREDFCFFFFNKREGLCKYAHVSPRSPFLRQYYIHLIHMHVLPLSLLKPIWGSNCSYLKY